MTDACLGRSSALCSFRGNCSLHSTRPCMLARLLLVCRHLSTLGISSTPCRNYLASNFLNKQLVFYAPCYHTVERSLEFEGFIKEPQRHGWQSMRLLHRDFQQLARLASSLVCDGRAHVNCCTLQGMLGHDLLGKRLQAHHFHLPQEAFCCATGCATVSFGRQNPHISNVWMPMTWQITNGNPSCNAKIPLSAITAGSRRSHPCSSQTLI